MAKQQHQHPIQDDMLALIPDELLRQLCQGMTHVSFTGQNQEHADCFAFIQRWVHNSKNTSEFCAIRLCSKHLRQISDNCRLGICLQGVQLDQMWPYLQRLTSLESMAIRCMGDAQHILHTLVTLQTVVPGLKTLKLHKLTRTSNCSADELLTAVLAWSTTLKVLVLSDMTVRLTHSSFEVILLQLPQLRTLELLDVIDIMTSKDIASATGLEKLTLSLSKARAGIWGSGSLDLSPCTRLQEVTCVKYDLAKLNVSGLTCLRKLDCSHNYIDELDVSTCTALQSLWCSYNVMYKLDLSANPAIIHVECACDQLGELILSGCVGLTWLKCSYCRVIALDLPACPDLRVLRFHQNYVDTLDLHACPGLRHLSADRSNYLVVLDLSGMTSLLTVVLTCCFTLTSLDVSHCSSLTSLQCDDSQIKSLDVSSCDSLQVLHLGGCDMTELQVNGCPRLRVLHADSNLHLATLDLSGMTCLTEVMLESCGELTFLTVSGCTLLESLKCSLCSDLVELHCVGCDVLQLLELEDCCRDLVLVEG